MPITPPPDVTATYSGMPIRLSWGGADGIDVTLVIPSALVALLDDDDLSTVIGVVEDAITRQFPDSPLLRLMEREASAPASVIQTWVREVSSGE
jgi:hypothetical protein